MISPGVVAAIHVAGVCGEPCGAVPCTAHTSAYEDGPDRRFRNVGNYKPDAGELP